MNDASSQTATLRQLLSGIIGTVPFGILTFSDQREVNIINAQAVTLLGFGDTAPREVLDQDYLEVLQHAPDLLDQVDKLFFHGKYRELDLKNVTVQGRNLNIKCRAMMKGVLIVLEDITEDNALLYRATHDALTQLINRQHFEDCVKDMLGKAVSSQRYGALVFMDLDNFKPVNDSAGHATGDELLRRIATLLKSRVRSGDLLGRIGGDEFAILLDNCSPGDAVSIVEDIRKKVERLVFSNQGLPIRITLSAGIAPFQTHAAPDISRLLSVADTACKIAKDEGRNRVHVIDDEHGEFETYIKSVKWLDELHQAMENGMLLLYGQRIDGIGASLDKPYYEVLLRLRKSDDEIVGPQSFIPVAERYHMMPEIDRYVMASLFRTMGSRAKCTYSVNLSGQTISDIGLVRFIEKMRNTYVFDPKCIVFEITETAAINDFEKTLQVMSLLKQQGFQFSLDDFGTGLSSFSYLKALPIDTLKIDGLFVKGMATDQVSYQMVKSIHDVAHVMGLQTVAEFVENQAIYDCLAKIGVQYAQGYHIHKPEPLAQLGLLKQEKAAAVN
ncbi:putative bifunctional diguanylate cyclase/phosphodiesterase [Photobacterium atrarenae]|uniref:EAL domain-containing protein n=1 Tax=Photobacterium atrarenae TaxID=865757 RepID=A0ABY5GJN2_9GAMM|nr:EAL domain-containing protein [Photobacterium atrarenae]UTV29376.1 EAL domain-containing protein [Photobacterium atrarenae]